jgi:glycosyltransferase involved in cell wall biosynthesis
VTGRASRDGGTPGFRLVVDCRYVRRDGRHDGISRFTAGITGGLGRLVPLTMLIDDERQLTLLPDLPWARTRPPTSVLEPLIPRVVNRLQPDVVLCPLQTSGSIGRRYGLVLTLHDLIYYRHRTPPAEFAWWVRLGWRLLYLSYLPQRLLLDRADEVVTVSATVADEIREHRLTRRRVTVVPNAADGEPLPAAAVGERDRSIVYMGAFIGYKDVPTLVRAAGLLPGWTLHLASRVPPGVRATLTRLAEEVGARVLFHDGVDEQQYAALLDAATVLASASLDEGFGLPVVEAMQRGVPVVLTDIPIFREVGGGAATYARAGDAAGFAARIAALADPEEWAARSAASLEQAAVYSWDASAARLLPVLQRVAAARR